MNSSKKNKPTETTFPQFLEALHASNTSTWTQLVTRLREVTLPWLIKRIGALPHYALISPSELANEVFAESLAKFYDLFQEGEFKKFQEFQSLMFKISELKLKEGLAKVKKDSHILRIATNQELENKLEADKNDQSKIENRKIIHNYLLSLPDADRTLLQRYYWGERLTDIAQDLGISEANCRKKKQRALNKLRQKFSQFLH